MKSIGKFGQLRKVSSLSIVPYAEAVGVELPSCNRLADRQASEPVRKRLDKLSDRATDSQSKFRQDLVLAERLLQEADDASRQGIDERWLAQACAHDDRR